MDLDSRSTTCGNDGEGAGSLLRPITGKRGRDLDLESPNPHQNNLNEVYDTCLFCNRIRW